jgi:glutamate-1-semialdehyde 2,1-aminomutase
MSHGASLLGHNHPKIKQALEYAQELGIICSYETVHHSALANKITQMVPCAEMVRFAGSGTETIMHAIRLARTATGRQKIIKFEGHFHGYSDDVLYSFAPPLERAGPSDAPIPYPQSAGIAQTSSKNIIVVPFNDPAALEQAFAAYGHEAATLIMEPVNYDAGCILPQPGFIQFCRELCNRYQVLLFFDEVLTAFRMAPGGAQEYFGIVSDLCVLGKAIGGGMPISAIAGKREVMRHFRPVGQSEHSGTYIAHLTSVLGARAALDEYSKPDFYPHLNRLGQRFFSGLTEIINRSPIPLTLQHVGPRFGLYFGIAGQEITNYRQAARQDYSIFHRFIAGCIKNGVYFHVSPHHGFSAAHTQGDLDQVLQVIERVLFEMADPLVSLDQSAT